MYTMHRSVRKSPRLQHASSASSSSSLAAESTTKKSRRGRKRKTMDTSTTSSDNFTTSPKRGKTSDEEPLNTGTSHVGTGDDSNNDETNAHSNMESGSLEPAQEAKNDPSSSDENKESERLKMEELLQKFGSPLEFNPMANLTQDQWSALYEGLSADDNEALQLQCLMDFCDNLSVMTEENMQSFRFDQFVPLLVKFLNYDHNPTMMLLACRSMSHLMEATPQAGSALTRYGAVPALCAKLLAIEYIDVAEVALNVLESMSEHASSASCILREGGLMAVLNYLDFFAVNVQRKAANTAANLVRSIPRDAVDAVCEAAPLLVNLLQHHDNQVAEKSALALCKIIEYLQANPERLRSIVTPTLQQNLIKLMSIATASTNNALGIANLAARMLATVCKTCPEYVEMLLVQNIAEILKNLLHELDATAKAQTKLSTAQHLYDLVNLISYLLPELPSDIASFLRHPPLQSMQYRAIAVKQNDKKSEEGTPDPRTILYNEQPQHLANLGDCLLPSLIRTYTAAVNPAVKYKTLTAICKIIHFATAEMLTSLLRDLTFSAFIASLVASKDYNIAATAVYMAEDLMKKLPSIFTKYFVREGVVHEVDSLLERLQASAITSPQSTPVKQTDQVVTSPPTTPLSPPPVATTEAAEHADSDDSSAEEGTPKASKKTATKAPTQAQLTQQWLIEHAKSFRMLFETHPGQRDEPEELTELLKHARKLTELLDSYIAAVNTEDIRSLESALENCMVSIAMLVGKGISTYELQQSRLVKVLLDFLSRSAAADTTKRRKRARIFLDAFSKRSPTEPTETLLHALVRELHGALDKVENFEVFIHLSPSVGSGLKYLTNPFKCRLERADSETTLPALDEPPVLAEPLANVSAVINFLHQRLISSDNQEPTSDNLESEKGEVDDSANTSVSEEKPQTNTTGGEEDENADRMDEDIVGASDEDEEDGMVESVMVQNVELSDDQQEASTRSQDTSRQQEAAFSAAAAASSTKSFQPEDIILELDGRELSPTSTIFQVVQTSFKATMTPENPQPIYRMWDKVYVMKYRLRPKSQGLIAETSATAATAQLSSTQHAMPSPSMDEAFLTTLDRLQCCPTDYTALCGANEETSNILKLFDLIYVLNQIGQSSNAVPEKEFVNSKIAGKLLRQLQDPLMICSNSLPDWCYVLSSRAHHLLPFDLRQLLFRTTSLGIARALVALQERMQDVVDVRLGRIQRQKVRIQRQRILESAYKVMELCKPNKSVLEVEYFGEVGTGLGPTLEFFTLVCRECQRKDLNVWIDEDATSAQTTATTANDEDAPLVRNRGGLYPTALKPNTPPEQREKTLKFFEFLGTFIAKALLDQRLLDIPLSRPFLKRILNIPLQLSDLSEVMPEFIRSIQGFVDLVEKKREIEYDVSLSPSEKTAKINALTYNGARIEDLCLSFVYPGDDTWELVPDGANVFVTLDNIDDYVNRVVNAVLFESTSQQFDAFVKGFNCLFPIQRLHVFTVEELDMLVCGTAQDQQPWDKATILENSKFEHGYTANSRAVVYLAELLEEFTPEQRRKFLKFASGSTRLPPRGWKDMNPKLTIVRKEAEPPLTPDDYLPSVNTCFFFLKLPDYSSKEKLRERLLFAIEHGQNAFLFN